MEKAANILEKFIPVAFIIAVFISVCAYKSEEKTSATVSQQDGLYIFYLSKPQAETETLGSVKVGITMTNKPEELLESLTKKAHKDFPQGEALIIGDLNMSRADVVKFK